MGGVSLSFDLTLQCMGYDHTAYVDYMDLAVRCLQTGR